MGIVLVLLLAMVLVGVLDSAAEVAFVLHP
jgi:hypothetical protein